MYTVGAKGCVPAGNRDASCDPAAPPRLEYFAEDTPAGFPHPRPMAPFAPLGENTWVFAVAVINSGGPDEGLFASCYKNPGDGGGEGGPAQGMCKWDDALNQLVKFGAEWPRNATLSLNGAKAVQRLSPTDAAASPQFVWFVDGFVSSRVPANAASIADHTQFEMLEPPASPAPGGQPWRCETVNYNVFAERYVCVGSADGNVKTVSFSHSLRGPYVNGTVVATHNSTGSSCYNTMHLAPFDLSNGTIFFACTLTSMWSNNQTLGPNLWSSCLFGSRLGSGQGCAPVAPRYEYVLLQPRTQRARLLPRPSVAHGPRPAPAPAPCRLRVCSRCSGMRGVLSRYNNLVYRVELARLL